MEQDLNAFMRKQATRLVESAKGCTDPELQNRLFAMAEDWLRQLPQAGAGKAPNRAAPKKS
jgi:hypothetical protein